MQLGSRWQTGQPPHPGVPESLHAAITRAEAEHPECSAWTLTWLEGRPRCALDEVLVLTCDPGGGVRLEQDEPDDEDDWLS